jgi:hypothetical protein
VRWNSDGGGHVHSGPPPFGGQADWDSAVAYVAVFTLVFSVALSSLSFCTPSDQENQVVLFSLGASRLIKWDYEGPDVEDADSQLQDVVKHFCGATSASFCSRTLRMKKIRTLQR